MHGNDTVFTGSIPQLYEHYMVPMIFEPYALDLSRRVAARRPQRVLELAAGTGVVTRAFARTLPGEAEIVATDLNQAMIDEAARIGAGRPVQWQQADAMRLPFEDGSFDVVACQFGAMFFPDRPQAYREAARVLRPGGAFLFNVWDRIEENDFIDTVCAALDQLFPDQPPRFMHRGPHGYADRAQLARDLESAGLRNIEMETVAECSRAPSARHAAIGYCQGNPMRAEIEAQGPGALERATDAATEALAQRFGRGAIEGRIQAHVAVAVP